MEYNLWEFWITILHMLCLVAQSRLCDPTRLLCPWDSPGKNTGVGCRALLQGNLPNPGTEPRSPAFQADSSSSEPPEKPYHTVHLKLIQWCMQLIKLENFSKKLHVSQKKDCLSDPQQSCPNHFLWFFSLGWLSFPRAVNPLKRNNSHLAQS